MEVFVILTEISDFIYGIFSHNTTLFSFFYYHSYLTLQIPLSFAFHYLLFVFFYSIQFSTSSSFLIALFVVPLSYFMMRFPPLLS